MKPLVPASGGTSRYGPMDGRISSTQRRAALCASVGDMYGLCLPSDAMLDDGGGQRTTPGVAPLV